MDKLRVIYVLYDWDNFTLKQKVLFVILCICFLPIEFVLWISIKLGDGAKVVKWYVDKYARYYAELYGFPTSYKEDVSNG